MAFGDDPAMERFRSEYFEERDGQMFLKMPHFKGPPMPISYELYLEFSARQETVNQIAKAIGIMCMMSGILFGSYRWLASDDLLQIFIFTGAGVVVAMFASVAIGILGSSPMGKIYGTWVKAQKAQEAARADIDHLF